MHVNVQLVVVEVDRIAMVEIVIHVVIVMIHVIVVVIHHDPRMIGKLWQEGLKWEKKLWFDFSIEVMIDDDVTHDHVVQFNIINVIIVNDQDPHPPSKISLSSN